MDRGNNRNHIEIVRAIKFMKLVLERLKDCQTNEETDIAKKCIHEMPKFEHKPGFRTRYSNILKRLANGSYSKEVVLEYFEEEYQRLLNEIVAL